MNIRMCLRAACVIVVASAWGGVAARATTLDFNWSLTGNGETVSGEITGLTDNATSSPTHFYVDAAGPTGLPQPLPLDLASDAYSGGTITVSNGAITGFNYTGIDSRIRLLYWIRPFRIIF